MNHQTITVMESHPVVMLTIEPGFTLATDWADGEHEMRRILDSHPEPLFYICDIRAMKMSLDDLIAGASLGTHGQDPIWHHPNMRSVYFISDSGLIKLAAAGLKSPAFGNVTASVFATVEEALADIERVMAAT